MPEYPEGESARDYACEVCGDESGWCGHTPEEQEAAFRLAEEEAGRG